MRLSQERIHDLKQREDTHFIEERPRSRALLERARSVMPASVPMSWMAGLYEHPPLFITEAKGTYMTELTA